MGHTKGYRRGTRYMFSRDFGKHGTIPLSTYLATFKIGDRVDIKVHIYHLFVICYRQRLYFVAVS
jgi:large subunit ribosomal protein L21e